MYNILMLGTTFSINGGVQNYIYNLITNLDTSLFSISYFARDVCQKETSFKEKLTVSGVKCLVLPNKILLSLYEFTDHLIKSKNKYNVVHIHLTSGRFLIFGILAKILTNAKVIFHSHTYKPRQETSLRERMIQLFYSLIGDAFLACSVSAGEYMFGKKTVTRKNFEVARNGISDDIFFINDDARRIIRKQYKLADNPVIGYVGRFSKEKNIGFIVDVFSHILYELPNAVLVLVGDGPETMSVKEKVATLGISEHVIFTGTKGNVSDFMNAFDLLLLASEFESLGIVLIEAQACGLSCMVSPGVLPDSHITPLWHQMKEGSDVAEWSRCAIDYLSSTHYDYWVEIERAGYSINTATKALQKFYLQMIDCNY